MINDLDVQDVLTRYQSWSQRRAVLSAAEGDGRQRVDPDDWADSDDVGVELAHELATSRAAPSGCGPGSRRELRAVMFTISHTAADGTVLTGTIRGDETGRTLTPLGWRWSGRQIAWYVPRSRDADPRVELIATTVSALKADGHDVQVLIDEEPRSYAMAEAAPGPHRHGRQHRRRPGRQNRSSSS